MDTSAHREKDDAPPVLEAQLLSREERKRSKSVESRGSSISSELDPELHKGARKRSKESTILKEKTVSQRISKAIEEEDAFLDYIKGLPAMSSEKVEAYKRSQSSVYKQSTSEVAGGLEHLDNLYRLMEHLGQLRLQNSKLQERVKYLENIAHEDVVTSHKIEQEAEIEDKHSRSKRSTKCKSSHYGIRQSFMKNTRERSRSVGVEEIMKSTTQYRLASTHEFESRSSGNVKSKVSKWTKVKEAFRWEKASNGVLPESKSQDSGIGAGEDVRYLRVPVPHGFCENSSNSASPADSVLSGQSAGGSKDCLGMPHISSSASTSDEDLEDSHFGVDTGMQVCSFRREYLDTKRSKSLDGESQLMTCELLDSESGKEHKSSHSGHKGMKSPWGKMKDIIQTKTGSVKKKKGDSDIEEDAKSAISAGECYVQDSQQEAEIAPDIHVLDAGECDILGKDYDKSLKRKLGPMLTITLPSTEELHSGPEPEICATTASKVSAKPPPSPQSDERHLKSSVKPKAIEESTSFKDKGDQHVPRKVSGGSAGTSPPTPRRLSKWSKVKNAFLTSGAPSEECLHRGSSSVPSSPVKSANFTYDIESDELSSGEFMDDNTRDDDVFPDPSDETYDLYVKNNNVHAEIQRNYEELQLKLSQEFHKKLCEWERIKSSGSPSTPPCSSRVAGSGFSSGTSSVGEDSTHDKGFRKKMEEWEKMKSPSGNISKHRESVTLQQLGEENLSPDFKKKLEEWEKMKSTQVPQTPDIVNISQPQFKKKITEWQLWRPGVVSSKSDAGIASISTPPAELPEDFYKKLQEWEKLKHGSYSTHPETDSPGNKTPSPGSSRRDCSDHKSGKTQHSPTSKKGTDFGFQLKIQKSKSHHEVKELAWLEKELHKIEREKQRLERERDKYLEREARLEKLRKAIGANLKKQEVLIPTSTGLFRFEGISQKFTRKLYEWEKAKGIGPEASTFALLDPGYQPPGSAASTQGSSMDGLANNGSLLTRSKSMGSVVDIVAMTGNQSTLTHQPSSLSLNHMEQLENNQLSCTLRNSVVELCGEVEVDRYQEPQAMIVDVEDVVEETASPLQHTPAVETQTPVYCYAPSEVTRLIDSSGSDSDREGRRGVQAQSSIELLQENISLLDKLQRKEDICRELECKIEDVEGKLHTTERIHREHLGTLVKDDSHLGKSSEKEQNMDEIKEKLLELESQKKELLEEGVTLQHSFVEHSEQQAMIAQDLVGKVKQLQDNITITTTTTTTVEPDDQQQPLNNNQDNQGQLESFSHVQELTSELLQLAEKLEHAVGERNQEISLLRKALNSSSRAPSLQKLRLNQHWFSSDSVSSIGVTDSFASQSSEDLTQLPVMLTNKLQELKTCLGSLTPNSDMKTQPVLPVKRVLNIVNPESPEVETTFVFNIRKKSTTETLTSDTDSLLLPKNVEENKNDVSNTETPAEKSKMQESLILHPTTVLTAIGNEIPALKSKNEEEDLKKETERRRNHHTESVVEFTYPLKTYFREDSREKRFMKKSGHISTDSDDSDYENKAKQVKSKGSSQSPESDTHESITVKKYKRNRNNSGLLERRRSRTDNKDENSDEEISNKQGLFESCTSKKCLNYDERYKKSTKVKALHKDSQDEQKDNIDEEVLPGTSAVELDNEASGETIRQLHSPKCIPRRNKKTSKNAKDSKSTNGNNCISYNYCCNAQNEEIVQNQEMTVNVFVPTTRKIFSPVRKDSKGETSTVISYVIEESVPSSPGENSLLSNPDIYQDTGIKKNKDIENISNKSENKQHKKDSKNEGNDLGTEEDTTDKKDEKPKYDFILPPCWIIKQVRAQSASPALQRRALQRSRSKDKVTEKESFDKISDSKDNKLSEENKTKDNSNKEAVNKDDKPKNLSETVYCSAISQSSADAHLQRESCRKNSSSSESVENSRPLRKEGNSIPSSLKLRSEAGFPPISPLTVRREMKVLKETAPSIRMMIAKYNQKVHESQELSGTKSPDSGTQSPIAWRSPITERRIKAQMEKYQEEVRKAFQNSANKDFYPHASLGQVQKSASAGYIRPFEKGCSNDSINERSEGADLSQTSYCHGILKSSSAGAIKSISPLSTKRQNVNNSVLSLQKGSMTPLITDNESKLPKNLVQSEPSVPKPIETAKYIHSNDKTDNDAEARKMKIPHIPPIPTVLHDESTNISQSDNNPQSTRTRALKIKKAKEEFLLRGCVRDSGQSGSQTGPSTPDTPVQSERMPWTDSKSRLSQISCGSESSYENVPTILVSGKEPSRDQDGMLLVKSASAGMINVDLASCSRVFCGSTTETFEQGVIPKSKSGILSRFRKARLKRHKEKEHSKLDTVSTLCRQSLVVDIHNRCQNGGDPLPSSSKSCPSSPVLHKKDQSPSGSWIRNPRRIFKPK